MPGLFYEECVPGSVFEHAMRRTVSEFDNVLYSSLTMNPAPLHMDAEYAATTFYGQRLVNSLFILGLVTGITVVDTTLGTTLGNLGFQEVTFPKPVFHGDTIHVRTEVLDRRPSKSRPGTGIVFWKHEGINQRDEVVCECRRSGLMMMRDSQDQQ